VAKIGANSTARAAVITDMTIAATTDLTIGAITVRTGVMIDATAGMIVGTTDNQAITENSETPAFGPAFSLHGAAPAAFLPSLTVRY
jgi:hypothetical protein